MASTSTPETVLFHARPWPGTWPILLSVLGVVLILAGVSMLWGAVAILLGVASWSAGSVTLTPRVLRYRSSLTSGTAELQVAKIETVVVGWAIGPAKSVAVRGTGGTIYNLGALKNAEQLRDQINALTAGAA